MQWGGWINLGATILIIASSVVTCAMRRTLVSRKARKKRIAENAEMSGANYFDNLNQTRAMNSVPAPPPSTGTATAIGDSSLPRAESPPPMNKGAQFAAFEMTSPSSRSLHGNDDRTPLNPSARSRSMDDERRRRAGPYYDDGNGTTNATSKHGQPRQTEEAKQRSVRQYHSRCKPEASRLCRIAGIARFERQRSRRIRTSSQRRTVWTF